MRFILSIFGLFGLLFAPVILTFGGGGLFSIFKKVADPAGFLSGNFNAADAIDPGGAIIKSVTGSDIGRQIADPGSLLSAPDLPDVPKAADAPTITDPEVQDAKRKERELARRRRGRSSTILTGPSGIPENTAKKTMLGG